MARKPKEKKPKKQKEVYIPKQGLMGIGEDYHVYYMTRQEKLTGLLIGAAAGLVIGYVFFNNWIVAVLLAIFAAVKIRKPYQDYLHKKRLKSLLLQFKDLLEALSASYSAGMATSKAFENAQGEMIQLYGPESDIAREMQIINVGLQHNLNIEDLLLNFADRSGLDDVNSFANVFDVCNRKGGNLQQIVGDTRKIINDKIDMEMEIQTMVAASKNELNIMMVMPLIIMLSMRGFGESMTGNSLANIVIKLAALAMFAAAYVRGKRMIEIKL